MNEIIFSIAFYVTTFIVIVSAIAAVFARNIVIAAFGLFFTLLGMTGFYILLGADFLAITQVIVYVGGILILMLFGVLLTHRTIQTLSLDTLKTYIGGIIAGALLFAALLYIIINTNWPLSAPGDYTPTTEPIGGLLLSKYLLPFEISSVTLLIALIGAAYIVRRKER